MEETKVLNLDGKEKFTEEVIQSNLPILVDFWAPWCRPCQMMAPTLDKLSILMDGKIKVVKINTEKPENQKLAIQFNIMSIPNLKLFQDGKVIKEFIGLIDLKPLQEEIEKSIN